MWSYVEEISSMLKILVTHMRGNESENLSSQHLQKNDTNPIKVLKIKLRN